MAVTPETTFSKAKATFEANRSKLTGQLPKEAIFVCKFHDISESFTDNGCVIVNMVCCSSERNIRYINHNVLLMSQFKRRSSVFLCFCCFF